MASFTKASAIFSLLVVLAFLIRLVLMPISVHSDLFFINIFPALMQEKNVFDIYSYFSKNLPSVPYIYYPPLTYFTFGAFHYFYSLFSSSFSNWMMALYSLEISGVQGQAADFIKASQNVHIFKDLFLAKFPYLICDIFTVLVFLKFIKNRVQARALTILWLFNPAHLYSTYLMGQFDIIPSFFVLLGFLLFKKNVFLGLLILGVAAAYKNYAFLFVLIAILVHGKNWTSHLKLAIISAAPYFLSLLPTLIHSPGWAAYSFLPKIYLHRSIPLVGWPLYSQYIKIIILAITLITTFIITGKVKIKNKYNLVIGLSLCTILLLFTFSPKMSFHFLLWEMPLILLWFKKPNVCSMIFGVQAISLASYKLLANHLQLGLFAPINPEYFSALPTFNSLIAQIIPHRIFSSIGFLIFTLMNLYLIFNILIRLLFQEDTTNK